MESAAALLFSAIVGLSIPICLFIAIYTQKGFVAVNVIIFTALTFILLLTGADENSDRGAAVATVLALFSIVTGVSTAAFLSIAIYLLPTFVATRRNHRNATAIAVLDIFFGWTVIGWVIAFVWSWTDYTRHCDGSGYFERCLSGTANHGSASACPGWICLARDQHRTVSP
jgi:Superinfection immunity protein